MFLSKPIHLFQSYSKGSQTSIPCISLQLCLLFYIFIVYWSALIVWMPFLLKCSIFPPTHTQFHPPFYDITPILVPIIPLANFQFISNKSLVYIISVCSYFLCLYLHKTSGFTKTDVKPDTKQVTAQDLLNTDNMWDFLISELLRTTDHHHD